MTTFVETRKKQYFLNLAAQVSGKFISIGASLAVFILIGRFLGPATLGQFSFILAFLSISIVFTDFGTSSVLSREIAQLSRPAMPVFWGNLLLLRLFLSFFAFIATAILAYFFRRDLFFPLLLGALAMPFIASRFFEPVFQVFKKPWFSSIPSSTYGTVYLLMIASALTFSNSLDNLVIAYIIANIIYGLIALMLSSRLLKPQFSLHRPQITNILKMSWPIGAASILALINTRADIFMLAFLKTDYEVGIYNAAFRLLDAAAILLVIVMNPLMPILSKDAIEDRAILKEHAANLMDLLFLISVPIAIITPLISPTIMSMLYGSSFIEAAAVVNILAWVGVLLCVSIFAMNLCVAIGVVHFGWWNAALAATINIILNYLWIPRFSYIGSAWATLVSEIILVGISFIYIKKHLGNIFRWSRWWRIILLNICFAFFMFFLREQGNVLYLLIVTAAYLLTLYLTGLIPKGIPKVINRNEE